MEYSGTIKFDTEVNVVDFQKAIITMEGIAEKANIFAGAAA